ncbi:hypothetical protein [Variovorax sp. DT-64]|uniref:hypothetical protein n=1 Tax=Variovorax sp. DT-64 TaxID=3396160 RepID=UPI003F1BAC78
MSFGSGSAVSGYAQRRARAPRALRVMSEKEIEAYLVARDAVRRIRRAAPLFAAFERPRTR